MAGVLLLVSGALQGLSAQTPDPTEASGRLGAPAPPRPPEVVSRDAEGQATIRAVRVEEPLRVDGRLEEAFYENTVSVSDFVQSLPVEGAAPSERTEAWVGFDETNIYVSARIWDSATEGGWVANEMRRDGTRIELNDHFAVYLDTFYDRRNSVGFVVNPLGGFSDLQVRNEADANADWNPVAEIRAGRFEGGWTVEMAIPFRSLRYRAGQDQIWGIQMRRAIVRKNEWVYLTYLPFSVVQSGPTGAMRVSRYGTLVGVQPPPAVSNDGYADAGLDVKYGITENLVADLTFNTDFAQVEADEQQTNLTQFSLFFPEKREFFLEGQGIFEFGNGGRGEGQSGGRGPPGASSATSRGRSRGGRSIFVPTLFYSRQIGLQEGTPVPILGGGRLTGKIGSFDVGAVGIRTRSDASIAADATTSTVLRVRRDVLGRSNVGAIFADRSNSAVAATGRNRAYGADVNFNFFEDLQVFGYYAKTETDGLGGRDDSYRTMAFWRGDFVGGGVDHLVVGEGFNPELGFLRRTGFRQINGFVRVAPRFESVAAVRQVSLGALVHYVEDEREGFLETRNLGSRLDVQFESGDWLQATFFDVEENLVEDTEIARALVPAGDYRFRDLELSYYFGPHRRLSGSVAATFGSFYSGNATSLSVNQGRIEVLPQLSIEPSVVLNWIDLPEIQTSDGAFDQHVVRTRLTYSLGPRSFLSGLLQYNTASDSFSSNVRLRWEWAPGSELFVVYSEDRDTDVLDRWSELASRALVVKLTRLFQL
jgi:hypothetical protein